jgi:hypothetical protein
LTSSHELGRSLRLALATTLFLVAGSPWSAHAQGCVPDATPDWMTSIPLSSSSAPVRPADCARVEQSPPDLSWPDLSSDAQYRVTLTYPDGHAKTLTAPQNWINWDEILPAGAYTWQVQVTNSSGTQVSRARRFTVDTAAIAFLVPDWTVLFDRATSKLRPRALPDIATAQIMIGQRQAEFGLLLAQVDSRLAEPVQAEPPAASSIPIIVELTDLACRKALAAALAWHVSHKEEHLADALRRALSLASWNPGGTTSYANAIEAARQIAGTLTLAYDWLYLRLDADQKNRLLAPILARATDMYNDLIANRARVAIHPQDSLGNPTLTHLGAMSVVLAGDVPEAQSWLRDALPLAINWTSPWGGEDGGFANGTSYAQFDTGSSLIPWNTLRWVVGVDIAQKAWVRNYARFITYFLPPGSPAGAFGDGAEQVLTENWARSGKAYALFAPSPLGRWYASQLTGEDPTRIELLLAAPADPGPAPYPAGTPNAALFPSIGWAAMHSILEDRSRVSVYFKSSPYGSAGHSHADQNSFVVTAGGQALAIDSGYYDGFDSPHWRQWYKQTRAHNAITFDGGQGQVIFEESGQLGPGAIIGFERHPGYDIVTGDATPAYGGALTEARRSMAYLRPNLLLVYDRLASGTPRQWEWNIHALNSMNVISDRRISIARNGQSLCVEMLAGPTMSFTQTDLFTVDPASGGFRQWHGNFHSVELAGAAEFIALLNVGCTPSAASATKANGVWTVPLGDSTVTIAADGSITVADTRPPTVAITSPASGVTVSGMVTVTASASDNFGVAGVQWQYNGINLGAEQTAPPYSITGDTTTVPNGMYTLTAVARDAAGNRTTSAPVTVTVSNDRSPPTLAITSPASGATVSGTITVTADASDNVGVAGVQFQYNGLNFDAEDTVPPYTATAVTNNAPNGSYTLTAVARDAAGNRTTSAPVTITVSNP